MNIKKKNKQSIVEECSIKKNTKSTWITNRTKSIEAYESGQINTIRKRLKKSDIKIYMKLFLRGLKNAC